MRAPATATACASATSSLSTWSRRCLARHPSDSIASAYISIVKAVPKLLSWGLGPCPSPLVLTCNPRTCALDLRQGSLPAERIATSISTPMEVRFSVSHDLVEDNMKPTQYPLRPKAAWAKELGRRTPRFFGKPSGSSSRSAPAHSRTPTAAPTSAAWRGSSDSWRTPPTKAGRSCWSRQGRSAPG